MIKKTKQITYISIMVMVMGGTIGAGIFFKNKTLSAMAQGNLGIIMATWGVGILAMLALALAIVEISSAQKSDKGILDWVKIFCPRWFYNASSNYYKWIFIPVTMFTIPLYLINALEDAGLPLKGEWSVLLIAFAVFMWFMITNLLSLKFSEVSQWIFTLIQTIPLLVFPIFAFMNAGDVEGTIIKKTIEAKQGFIGSSPWLATIAGVSAISFAYDGFYASASVRNEMNDPKKLGLGLAGGVIGVSIVYLFLTIGFNMAGNGSITGLQKFMSSNVYKMLNGFIAVGIMGVANTYAMSSPRIFKDSIKEDGSKDVLWIQKVLYRTKVKKDDYKQLFISSWLIVVIISTLFYIIVGPIGAYVYNDASFDYGSEYAGSRIYGFSDVITNFTSLLIFVILATSILGGLINRRTKKIKVERSKIFVSSGIIAVLIIYIAAIYMIVESVINLTGYNGVDMKSSIILFSVFVAILTLSIVPAIIKEIIIRKKLVK